ncbi:hypothetical protein BIT31_26890 [Klebsiella pneumoniae]|nr:hypothetical protein BIT31_26890 [Klebsiella pneumoniae]
MWVPGEDRRDIGVKFIFRQLGQGDKIRRALFGEQTIVGGIKQIVIVEQGVGARRRSPRYRR